ncbi:hypothetical protein JCM9279_000720 [Rhodotorula babjevae]
MAAAAQAARQPPPSSYPSLGTAFPSFSSLSALVHSACPTPPTSSHLDSPIAAPGPADSSPPELIERRKGAEVSWTCKLGTRKPGRRRAGERRKSVEELCGFRLTAERRSTSAPDSSSSSTTWLVTSFSPHVTAVHSQGWTASEGHDAAVRAGLAPPPPVVLPARDSAGRFQRSRSTASSTAEPTGGYSVQGDGATEVNGEGDSLPPDTMRMKGGTLVPLVPLAPGPLVHVHVKRVRPRRDKEHVGDEAWDAWTTMWWGERSEGEERRAPRRKEERERTERMGGYGALRSWGWCEGLLEPVSDEEELPPVQEDVAAEDPPPDPAAALQCLVFEIIPSAFPSPPSPPLIVSPTQPRKRSSDRPASTRSSKRSRTALDPEWRPVFATRSQRSATRSVAVLDDINEDGGEEEAQGEEALEPDEDERGGMTSPDDLPPLRQSSPIVQFPSHLSSTLPIRPTVAAFTPFTSSSRRPSAASSTAPSPSTAFSSPTTSRGTSFGHDSTTTSDTSFFPSEDSPYPSTAARAATAAAPPTPLRPLRPRPPLAPILAAPPPLPQQQHSKKPASKQRRPRSSQPRACRAPTSPPGVHASASAAAAEAHASAGEARSRLEEEAVWALMGMGWSASAGRAREAVGGAGAGEAAGEVRAAAGVGASQRWEREQWGV